MNWKPRRRSYPITCDGQTHINLPVAHAESRTCPATGKTYWTVDADPHDCCPAHQDKQTDEAEAIA